MNVKLNEKGEFHSFPVPGKALRGNFNKTSKMLSDIYCSIPKKLSFAPVA